MSTQRFSSSFARDLFLLGCEMSKQARLASPPQESIPSIPVDNKRVAGEHDETFNEGRVPRTTFRRNFKE